MTQTRAYSARSRIVRTFLAFVATTLVAFASTTERMSIVRAQSAAAPTGAADAAFDVVSIKRNKEAEEEREELRGNVAVAPSQMIVQPGGVLRGEGISLMELIRDAYDFRLRPKGDISGGPSWLETERYDVTAKTSSTFGAAPPNALPPDAARMLRALLADRFKLKMKTETRQRPLFNMVLAKADGKLGAQLKPADGSCLGIYTQQPPPPARPLPPCQFQLGGGRPLILGGITMKEFATFLANFPVINATVTDKTGLTGAYDLTVRFQGAQRAVTNTLSADQAELPLLPQAIEQQLGLKLEKTEGPVDVIVIERAEHPSQN